jgi:uncharacterized membrane protein YkvA (DUF1232 family)
MAKIPVMKKVAQIRSLAGLWRYRAELFSMFGEMIRGTYRASFLTLMALALGAIYVLSPIDLIPDFLILAGWVDDGAIIYFLLRRLMHELNRYMAGRSRRVVISRWSV